jgi:transcriptional regulator with XRE-family HTH domain
MADSPLKERRIKLGWTLEHAAKEAGTTAGQLSRMERGSLPNVVLGHRIARAMKSTIPKLWPEAEA